MALASLIAAPCRSVFSSGDDVHVWTVRHDDASAPDEDARRIDVLSAAEVVRYNRLKNPRQRAGRIHARAALRHILSSYLGTSAARIAIGTGIHGKPTVAGVEFNCSHAPSLTLIAVGAQPIGVDVEPIGASEGIDAFCHRFINDIDLGDAEERPQSLASIEMLRLWVIKEACLKATGTGLSADPRELCVRRRSPGEFDVSRGAGALRARLLPIPGGHVAAVAARALGQVVVRDEVAL